MLFTRFRKFALAIRCTRRHSVTIQMQKLLIQVSDQRKRHFLGDVESQPNNERRIR